MLGRTSRSKYAVQKKSSKKTAPGRGTPSDTCSHRYSNNVVGVSMI